MDTNSDEVKEEDDQELIINSIEETCSKHIRGFRRHSCLYKPRLICMWQQYSRQTCTCVCVCRNVFLLHQPRAVNSFHTKGEVKISVAAVGEKIGLKLCE